MLQKVHINMLKCSKTSSKDGYSFGARCVLSRRVAGLPETKSLLGVLNGIQILRNCYVCIAKAGQFFVMTNNVSQSFSFHTWQLHKHQKF